MISKNIEHEIFRGDDEVITEEALERRIEFFSNTRGCSCHTGMAPCSHCTDERHPISQFEDDLCWRKLTEREMAQRFAHGYKRKVDLDE